MTDVDRYWDLFVHRSDVYAEQQSDGAYFPQRFPLTKADVLEHLDGWASYGTYVIRPIEEVATVYDAQDGPHYHDVPVNDIKYVVFDLDTYDEDALEHLKWCVTSVVNDLADVRHKCLLLESSGGKGFHVWLFLSEPVPAVQVRRWLGWAFWPLWLEAAADAPDWPALEVFPKQDSVDEGGFGNLVKLPLGVHAKTGNKSEFLPVTDWASAVNEVVPLDVSLLPSLESAPVEVAGSGSDSSNTVPTSPRGQTPFPCIDRILTGDLYPGIRDEGMFHLALFLYGQGLDQELALAQCRKVNERMENPLRDSEVLTKVRSAYSGRHRAGCRLDWLRDYCPGPCPVWARAGGSANSQLARIKVDDTLTVEVVAVTSSNGRKRITITHPDAENAPTLIVSD